MWTKNSKMPFGKYKGAEIKNINKNYLYWVSKQSWVNKELRNFLEDYSQYSNNHGDMMSGELEEGYM